MGYTVAQFLMNEVEKRLENLVEYKVHDTVVLDEEAMSKLLSLIREIGVGVTEASWGSKKIYEFSDGSRIVLEENKPSDNPRKEGSEAWKEKEMSRIPWAHRTDREEFEKAYETLSKASGFEVGDKVRILRKFESWELGCNCGWFSSKEEYIGQVGEIVDISNRGSIHILLGCEGFYYSFPFFVLELVEPVKKTHTITIDGKSTEVSEDTREQILALLTQEGTS